MTLKSGVEKRGVERDDLPRVKLGRKSSFRREEKESIFKKCIRSMGTDLDNCLITAIYSFFPFLLQYS